MQSHTYHQGPDPREAQPNLRRTLQSHLLFQARQLTLGDVGLEETTATMEYRAFETIPSVDVMDKCIHV